MTFAPLRHCLCLALTCLTAASASAAERIPLTVQRHREGAPITVGVPFPKGALASPDHVRVVTLDGSEVPSQVTTVTTWHPADASVKWVWVFFFAGAGDRYAIEFGADVRRAHVPAGLEGPLLALNSQRTNGTSDIVTGPLHATVRQGEGGLFSQVSLDLDGDGFDADDVIAVGPADGRGSFVDLLDRAGVDASRATVQQTFIEKGSGPLHAIVRIEGTYRYGRDDNTAAPFVTRVHAYAGQSYLRILHTMIYTGTPDLHVAEDGDYPHVATQGTHLTRGNPQDPGWTQPDDRIAGMGLGLALRLGPDARVRSAVVPGDWWRAEVPSRHVEVAATPGAVVALTQTGPAQVGGVLPESSPDTRQNGFTASLREGTREVATGGRTPGWIDVCDRRRGVALGLRHFLEAFPKELRYTSGTGQLDGYFWSPAGGAMSFARQSSTPGAEGSVENWAQGLARTSEAILYLHGPDATTADIETTMAYVLDPSVAVLDPMWYAASGVYGRFAPRGTGPAELDRALDHKVEWMLFNQRWAPWYGVFDFGDMKQRYDNGRWDMWGHNEPAQDFQLWMHFMRTGDARVFDAALAFSRHTMDVDNTHWPAGPRYRGDSNQAIDYWRTLDEPPASKWLGVGRRHSAQHWMHALSAHVWVQGWMAAYYLAADHRALDVARLTADMHRRRLWGEHDLTGRRLYLSVWNLAEVWDATKDDVYRVELEDRVAHMLRLQAADADMLALERYGYAQVYATHGLARYHAMTGDPAVREALVRHARRERDVPALNHWMESYLASLHALSVGYELSGEPSLREELARRVALLRTDPLSAPPSAPSWTQASLATALAATAHIPDAPAWYRREFSAAARARTPNWHPLHGLRFFGWTTGHGLPWALGTLYLPRPSQAGHPADLPPTAPTSPSDSRRHRQ